MEWYLTVLRQYAVFRGRARRKEYWMFFLVNLLIAVAINVAAGMLGDLLGGGLAVLGLVYSLAVLVPGVAVGVRRLHDTGRSGWWMLVALVPILGAIAIIVFLAQDSQPAENQYGPNPKAAMA